MVDGGCCETFYLFKSLDINMVNTLHNMWIYLTMVIIADKKSFGEVVELAHNF